MELYWGVQDWAWGLSLIVLTTAVHTVGVVMMALVGLNSAAGWRPGALVCGMRS